MFKIGEKVIHNKVGLCTIIEMTKINDIDYYVLNSNKSNETKIMIPVNNANNLIREVITKEEIEDLVKRIPKIEVDTIVDFKTRVKKYDELLKSGETEKLVILLKMIYKYKKEKRNLTVAEKEILKTAEKLLYEEIAFTLKIELNDVEKYLFKSAS